MLKGEAGEVPEDYNKHLYLIKKDGNSKVSLPVNEFTRPKDLQAVVSAWTCWPSDGDWNKSD